MTIRVMLVDDSAVVRGLISRALTSDSDIEVVTTAANGSAAITLAERYTPDVIILDIEMPIMDGMTALPELLKISPSSKIIMASTLTARNAGISLQALEQGAADYIPKPSATRDADALAQFHRELLFKVRVLGGGLASAQPPLHSPKADMAALNGVSAPVGTEAPAVAEKVSAPMPTGQAAYPPHPVQALAIASSTGGPQALIKLFEELKGQLGHIPIFITQHMPPTFTTLLAEHITKAGGRECMEAKDGDVAKPGHVYLAPGNFHMVLERKGVHTALRLNQDPPENFCRPAADPMLRSLSAIYGQNLLVLVLTGMGQDGLEGARAVSKRGGTIVAQDEATSVVWGMPRAVAEHGLCRAVLPLNQIAGYVSRACHAPR